MNFFEQQAQARKASRRLLLAFAGSVLAVGGLVVLLVEFGALYDRRPGVSVEQALNQTLPVAIFLALAMLLVIAVASLYKVAKLKSGGATIALQLGAVRVQPGSRNLHERRLHNVVEEIAIASGVPVPQVFVLEQEPGINAFAAGFTPADAAITVTRGALEKLSRDELQGVVAHEFSHILNGDMRLNIRLMGVVFGLLVIYLIGREILDRSPRFAKRGATVPLALGLSLILLGQVGMFFGRLIKAGISRQREFLADASAVQFTRQTDGLAGALQKVAGIAAGSRLQATNGEEVSHMLFGEGLAPHRLFATHPPLIERIQRLQPQFSMAALRLKSKIWNTPDFVEPLLDEELATSALAPQGRASSAMSPAQVVGHVAHPGQADYRQAEWIAAAIPDALRRLAEDAASAPGLLLALLMSDASAANTAHTSTALALIASRTGQPQADAVAALLNPMRLLDRALRLPLASIGFAALRSRPEAELRLWQALIDEVTASDGQVGAFEFVLGHLLRVQLDDWFAPAANRTQGRLRLDACTDAVAALLGLMASAGTTDPKTARQALARGWSHLYGAQASAPSPAASTAALDAGLLQLDALLPFAKQMLIEAMVQVLAFDGRTTVGEAELLRVVCASLHCPLPADLLGEQH